MARHSKPVRRRRLRKNPLSTKQKIGVVGGLVLVGGVAAYALTASPASAQGTGPTGPTVDPRVAKQAECDALRGSLAALRAQATPDRASMTQLEAQLAQCLSQARELGVPIDPATAHTAEGDASRAQMDQWFAEYKATSDHDPLRRNNIRQSILGAGTALAATYTDAITQSPNNDATKLIAQSLVAAIDASITRKLCFLSNERGCGTFGANEDQPDAKAAQEQDRVLTPLVTAYMQAVAKVGGPSQALAWADGEKFLAAMLRPCAFLKTYIDGQFAHYKATEWSDALKRNNTRQSILAAGRDLTSCLQTVFTTASSFGSAAKMREVATIAIAALNASIDRWKCFFMNERGCGTFASNEDQPDAKAAQEMANTAVPLMNLYAQIARALVARGDVRAYEPLVTAKLRVCSTLREYINGQFAHYKATEWSDALKRNNTRQTMLATGAALATCLQDALATAASAKRATVAPASGTSGLGATTPLLFMPVRLSTIPSGVLTQMAAPRSVDITKMVRDVAAVAVPALDDAMQRKLCYLYDQSGCGRFGENEASNDSKAADEQNRVINPLIVVIKEAVAADKSNAQAEVPLMRTLGREVATAKDYIDAQYGNLKRTDYSDGLKRTNIRGSMIQAGQRLVAALRDARPATVEGKKALRSIAQSALNASREREACYRSGASGCDRIDDAGYGAAVFFSGGAYAAGGREDDRNVKADQEKREIGDPIAAILANRSTGGLAGLGDGDEVLGLSPYTWLGIGAVALIAAGAYHASQKKVRRNRTRRRTSRRLSA